MKRPLYFRISGVCIAALVLGCFQVRAQSEYYDVTSDGSYLYTDLYGDSAPPDSCPSYTEVDSTLAGVGVSGSASYPDTAHVSQSVAATAGTDYSWTRDVIHYGTQRGGNCGAFLEP